MASETFGEWLKRLRIQRGETLRSLADKAGVSDTYVSLLESGQRAGRRAKVEQIAKALDTDVSDALRRAGFLPDESVKGELIRVPEDAAFIVEAYNGATPQNKEMLRRMAQFVREVESEHTLGGKNFIKDEDGSNDEGDE